MRRPGYEVQAYRFGEHEWYTAAGVAYFEGEFTAGPAGASWTTSVLFTPDVANPRLTILRHDLPLPLSGEEFTSLGLSTPVISIAPLAATVADFIRTFAPKLQQQASRGLPRTYEGALKSQAHKSAVERRLQTLIDEEDKTRE